MKKLLVDQVHFVKSAQKEKDYPLFATPAGALIPEIAVAGRSNVGKSTLLNHLFNRKNLVKTSSTPGKTQLINFFLVPEQMAFADLPGYGFAKVASNVKKNWAPMIETYLKKRENLRAVLLLLDIRRIPSQEDKMFLDWIEHYEKPVIFVLTKLDKVSPAELRKNTQQICEVLRIDNTDAMITYSAVKNRGRKELLNLLEECR